MKLWRKSLDGGWLKDHKLWAVWCYCLLKASHTEHKVVIGRQEVLLQPGQFVFGRFEAAAKLNMAPTTVYRIIIWLREHGNIALQTSNKFSIITIVNWQSYQSADDESGQHMDREWKTNGQQTDTYKNG